MCTRLSRGKYLAFKMSLVWEFRRTTNYSEFRTSSSACWASRISKKFTCLQSLWMCFSEPDRRWRVWFGGNLSAAVFVEIVTFCICFMAFFCRYSLIQQSSHRNANFDVFITCGERGIYAFSVHQFRNRLAGMRLRKNLGQTIYTWHNIVPPLELYGCRDTENMRQKCAEWRHQRQI